MNTKDSIWIGRNGQRFGPYTELNIRQWLTEGKLTFDTMAWRSGMQEWAPLSTLLHVADAHENVPPPPAKSASVSGADFRTNTPDPPSLHWFLVFILSLLTFGIFSWVWSFIQARWVKKIDKANSGLVILTIGLVCAVLGGFLYGFGLASSSSGVTWFGSLLIFAGDVLFIVAYFSMAGSLRRFAASLNLPMQIGGITLFFFNVYYFQGQLTWIARWMRTGQVDPKAPKGVVWLLFLLPFILALLAAIAVPAYQSYLVRSQVSEGLVLADGAKVAIAEYYSNQGALPGDNASAGLSNPSSISGKYVSSVAISGGRIVVSFDEPSSSAALRGKILVLTPSENGGVLDWSCSSTIPNEYLPETCRD